MSGGDNTSARVIDIRTADGIAKIIDVIAGVQALAEIGTTPGANLNAAQVDLEAALAAVAKRIKDREVEINGPKDDAASD